MTFVVPCISLILSLFLSSSRFLKIISVNSSGLFLLYLAMYTKGFFVVMLFWVP